MASRELDPSQPSTPVPLPDLALRRSAEVVHRFPVNIEAYVQMSFDEEVELTGSIGSEIFSAESRSTRRGIRVAGSVGSESVELTTGLRRFRPLPVSGHVLGQAVTGSVVRRHSTVIFEGMAGQEPLRYELDARGGCSNFDTNLGIKIIYQAFFSEILGSVDRIPDAVMIALLLPLAVQKRDPNQDVRR